MAITDPAAVAFSNEQFRQIADRLGRCYYLGKQLRQQWLALTGTNDEKVTILFDDIIRVGTLYTRTFKRCWNADHVWNAESVHLLFPNDVNEVLFDNLTGDNYDTTRGQVNGQDLRRLKNRMEEFSNWLSRGTDLDKAWTTDALAVLPITYDYYRTCVRVSEDRVGTPSTNDCRIFVVDRCGELLTQYETNTPASLNNILKVAVRPGDDV